MKHIFSTFFFLYFILMVPLAIPAHAQAEEDCSYEVTVSEVSPNTKCKGPTGELLAQVSESEGSFTFLWYPASHLNDPDYLMGTTARVTNLESGEYAVVVTNEATNCSQTAIGVVHDETNPPVLELVESRDKTTCSDPSDSYMAVALLSSASTENVHIRWYQVPEEGEPQVISVYTNMMVIEGAPPGVYMAIATDPTIGCDSNHITVEIEDETVYPVVAGTIVPNTACDAALANGSISLGISMPDGHAEPADGYEVAWFAGSSAEGTVLEATEATVEGLAAGTYTAVVTNAESGCSVERTFAVAENLSIPELTATTEPNTVCDPEQASGGAYTGAISLELMQDGITVADPADYLISWYRLEGGEGSLLEENAALNREGLAPGLYRIIATRLSSGCESAALDIAVEEETEIPVVEISNRTNMSSCQEPDGSVSATVTGGSSENIVFRWYSGEEVNEANHLEAGGNGATIEGLAAGSYTVVATNTQSGCVSAPETVNVTDETSLPLVEMTNIQHVSHCNAPNGAAEAYVQVDDQQVTEGYTFNWYAGTIAKATPDYTGPSVTALAEGAYSVEAIHNESGCVSALQHLTIEVEDYPYEVQAEVVSANTACEEEAYNGTLSARVVDANGAEVEGDFTFSWYPAALAGEAEHVVHTGAIVEQLGGGEYTVIMTDNITACTSRATITVPDEPLQPILSLQLNQHITQCDNPSAGAIQASLNIAGEYTVRWYRGEEVAEENRITNESSLELTGYPAGVYTAQAVHNTTLCVSTVETVEIEDLTASPEVEGTIAGNTACDAELANGSITLSISTPLPGADPEGGYQVEWFRGTGTDGTSLEFTGIMLEGLAAGSYTAVVTNPENNCSSEHTFTIDDELLVPELSMASVVPNRVCDPSLASEGAYTGAISLDLLLTGTVVTEPSDYIISWYLLEGEDETLLDENGALSQDELPAGSYRIVATHQQSGCTSMPLVVEVEEATDTPVVEAVNLQPLTHCNEANGAIEILPAGNGDGAEYRVEWYQGDEVTAEQHLEEHSGQYLIAGLAAGSYTVQSTNILTGCQSVPLTLVVEDAIEVPSVTVESTPLTNCNPNRPDGAFSFNVNGETTGYSFVLYRGSEADEAALAGEGSQIEGLREGQYLLVTTAEATSCVSSSFISIETGITFPEPPVTIGAESCEAAELTLRIEGNGTYYWYTQPDGGNAFHAGSSFFENFNQTTTYYVATVNEDGCESRERSPVSAVIHQLEEPVIEADGNVLSTTLDDSFTYRWYLDGELLAETEHSLTAEISGTYEVEVTNEAGCSIRSTPYAFTVSAVIDKEYDAAIKVYPNPFRNRLHISLAWEAGITSIRLLDGQMRQLTSITVTDKNEPLVLDLSDLPQGMYYIEIREGEKVSYKRVARQ